MGFEQDRFIELGSAVREKNGIGDGSRLIPPSRLPFRARHEINLQPHNFGSILAEHIPVLTEQSGMSKA